MGRSIFNMNTRTAILIIFAALAVACAPKAQMHEFELDKLVGAVEKRAYIVKRFRAAFTKTRHSSLFQRDLKVEGSLVFVKPNRFRMTTRGDVNVEVISDGKTIALTHDGKDIETYRLQGDRDMSRFADPLLLLVNRIGNGGFRKFAVDVVSQDLQSTELELNPGTLTHFERMDKALLSFGKSGMLERVRIVYKNGNWDETVFRSWSILTPNDPDLLRLDKELKVLGTGAASALPQRIEARSGLPRHSYSDPHSRPLFPGRSARIARVSTQNEDSPLGTLHGSVLTTTP